MVKYCHGPLVQSTQQKNMFLISQPKYMLQVLKRTVSMKHMPEKWVIIGSLNG